MGPVGPSTAYSDVGYDIYEEDGTEHVMRTVSVPAGSYAVTATLALSNNDLNKPTTINCRLFSGNQEASVGDADLPARGPDYPSYQDGTIAMTGVITLNAAANINVGCRLSAASGITFGDSYLVATKVGSVVNQ